MNEQTTTNTAAHDEPLAVLPPVDDDAVREWMLRRGGSNLSSIAS